MRMRFYLRKEITCRTSKSLETQQPGILAGIMVFLLSLCVQQSYGQQLTVQSPNKKIVVTLLSEGADNQQTWHMRASLRDQGKSSVVIPEITLGLKRSDQEFSKGLRFLKKSNERLITEKYIALHGNQKLTFPFLKEGAKYTLRLIADGQHDKVFSYKTVEVDQSSSIDVKLLRRGGFAATLVPLP